MQYILGKDIKIYRIILRFSRRRRCRARPRLAETFGIPRRRRPGSKI